jgi:predicted GIY-YIG superfamily endonuclease
MLMAWVYILRGSNGRHYIGSTLNPHFSRPREKCAQRADIRRGQPRKLSLNIDRRLNEHRSGGTHTTQRLGSNIDLVIVRHLPSLAEARELERDLKKKKNPRLAIYLLQQLPDTGE